jgi:hypothetical protein
MEKRREQKVPGREPPGSSMLCCIPSGEDHAEKHIMFGGFDGLRAAGNGAE